MIKERLFHTIDFSKVFDDLYFIEDSVREVIILPILKELGKQNYFLLLINNQGLNLVSI